MPYIPMYRRAELDSNPTPLTSGELNYCMFKLAMDYVFGYGINYTRLGECIAAFECAKLEFYRRVVVPYEEKKIKENGDIEVHP